MGTIMGFLEKAWEWISSFGTMAKTWISTRSEKMKGQINSMLEKWGQDNPMMGMLLSALGFDIPEKAPGGTPAPTQTAGAGQTTQQPAPGANPQGAAPPAPTGASPQGAPPAPTGATAQTADAQRQAQEAATREYVSQALGQASQGLNTDFANSVLGGKKTAAVPGVAPRPTA